MKGEIDKSHFWKLENEKIGIFVHHSDFKKIKSIPESKNTYSLFKDKKLIMYGMHYIVEKNDEMYKKLFKVLKLTVTKDEWKPERKKRETKVKEKGG